IPMAGRRGVELARALALAPSVLLLDEPAAGLDEAERQALAARLRAIAATGIGMLVIEHDLGFLLALAGRVVCLDRGRVVAEGAPESVRRDPAVIEAFLGIAA